MIIDRMKEYKVSLEDAANYPDALNNVGTRLKKRILRKRRNTFLTGVGALILLFVLLVNTPTVMADAIFDIPVIGKLAEYVSFDKGLQNAIKNEYAKEVNLVEQSNGYTLGIPYVIADNKRLVIFYQLSDNVIEDENGCVHININKIEDITTGKRYESYTSEIPFYTKKDRKDNDGLIYGSVRSVDYPLPREVRIYVTMTREEFSTNGQAKEFQASDLFEPAANTQMEELGDFIFDLHLDEYPEPKVTLLNEEVEVEGQTIHLDSITQYPTGTEVSVTIPNINSYMINGLRIKAIDSNAEEWCNSGGITSYGSYEKGKIIYYLEGDYFNSSSLSKIKIDGIRMFKKSEATFTIDLLNKTMTPEVDGIRIKSIDRAGEKAYLTFELDKSDCFGFFKHEYQDSTGNKYHFISESLTESKEKVENYLAVVWPKDNKVIMSRSMSPMLELKEPVEIELPN